MVFLASKDDSQPSLLEGSKTRTNPYWQAFFILIIFSSYCILFNAILHPEYVADFTAFYSAGLELLDNRNPYRSLSSNFLTITKQLSANLNPPIVLWCFQPLAKLSYPTSSLIWIALVFISGSIGAWIAFYYTFSVNFLKKNGLCLYLLYLSLFSTLMNATIGQFGSFLLFFMMLGYHFYLKKFDYLAGILWGCIISFKLFPALLFFFVLKQGRFKVFALMLVTFLLACLIPYLAYGSIIYTQYYKMMSVVLWYGDNWNASIYGFIFRIFIDPRDIGQNLVPLQIFYVFLFFISLIWYLKKLGQAIFTL